jgi:hypothetical protein
MEMPGREVVADRGLGYGTLLRIAARIRQTHHAETIRTSSCAKYPLGVAHAPQLRRGGVLTRSREEATSHGMDGTRTSFYSASSFSIT